MTKHRTRLVASILGVAALWLVPAVANAQVTITSVKVTVSSPAKTAVYCNISLACTAIADSVPVWDLGATGTFVDVGKTLVLAQTGVVAGDSFGNFDTSDRATLQLPREAACTVSDHCTVEIVINGTTVYSSNAGVPLNFFNTDTPANSTDNEGHQWMPPVFSTTNYSLSLGYADNEHGTTCAAGVAPCFPSPFFATADNTFNGGGVPYSSGSCPGNSVTPHVDCYDSGALLITGIQPPATGCTLTQGGYKNHFNSLVLNLPAPKLVLGTVSYTNSEINSILQNNVVKGNGLISLAHQLATAKLNIRYGASAPLAVQLAITAADALIGGLVVPPVGSGYLTPASTSALETILDDFNNGLTGPGHCN